MICIFGIFFDNRGIFVGNEWFEDDFFDSDTMYDNFKYFDKLFLIDKILIEAKLFNGS